MATHDDPAKPKPSAREIKLAQALRANLRRRKTGAEPSAPAAAPKPPKAD
ncbi:MAG: hypothetical protein JWP86_3133 [Phenylobacterium sp.]|nr:hypothetical protein [Phenylobacterium sp.]